MVTEIAKGVVVAGAVIWIVWGAGAYLFHIVRPVRAITFSQFETPNEDLSKQCPRMLSTMLEQIRHSGPRTPPTHGFLRLPALISVPEEARVHTATLSKQLEGIDLKIKDVDVGVVARLLSSLFSAPEYQVNGRVVEFPDSVEASCELVLGDESQGSWSSRTGKKETDKTLDPAVLKATAATLLDDLVFQILFDFMTDKRYESWKVSQSSEYEPTSWRSLQAVMHGTRALSSYEYTADPRDLADAIEFLGRIPLVAPSDFYGLYFYGVALSQDRREGEAAAAFQGAVLRSKDMPQKWDAQFNEAAARLKLYTTEQADVARSRLEEIESEVTGEIKAVKKKPGADNPRPVEIENEVTGDAEAIKEKPARDNLWQLHAFRAITRAQILYTMGTRLSLRGGKPKDCLHYFTIQIEPVLDRAMADLREVEGASIPNDQLVETVNQIKFRINNSSGYSRYRAAQLEYGSGDKFKAACEKAIEDLEAALKLYPRDYEALQNLGMIYNDEAFDRTGEYLDRAESTFRLTTKYVPNDYYQYEQLAKIYWRRVHAYEKNHATLEYVEPLIKEGQDAAKKALVLRRAISRAATEYLARFAGLRWTLTPSGDSSRAARAEEATKLFDAAIQAAPENAELSQARMEFSKELALAEGATPVQTTEKRRLVALAEKLDKFIGEAKAKLSAAHQ